MKKTVLLTLATAFVLLILHSCEKACTEEFRMVTITVNGDQLDDFYTLRLSSGDTIRYDNGNVMDSTTYVVLDDSYQMMLENKTDSFRFEGILNDSLMVSEVFIIKADECHIEYISGKQTVNM